MKIKKIIYIFIFLIILVGCDKVNTIKKYDIILKGDALVGSVIDIEVFQENNKLDRKDLLITIDNKEAASLSYNEIKCIKEGVVNIRVISLKDDTIIEKKIEVRSPKITYVSFDIMNKLFVGQEMQLQPKTVPADVDVEYNITSSNPDVITVYKNTITCLSEGWATIKIKSEGLEYSRLIEVSKKTPEIKMLNSNIMSVNEVLKLKFDVDAPEIRIHGKDKVEVHGDAIVGKETGVILVVAKKDNLVSTFEIYIGENIQREKEINKQEKKEIDSIIKNMSLQQKVGQLFQLNIYEIVAVYEKNNNLYFDDKSYKGTINSKNMSEIFNKYKIGNISSHSNISTEGIKLIQDHFVKTNTVGGILTYYMEKPRYYYYDRESFPINRRGLGINNSVYDAYDYYSKFIDSLNGYNNFINRAFHLEKKNDYFSKNDQKEYSFSKAMQKAIEDNQSSMALVVGWPLYYDSTEAETEAHLRNMKTAMDAGIDTIAISTNSTTKLVAKPHDSFSDYIRKYLKYEGLIFYNDSDLTSFAEPGQVGKRAIKSIEQGIDILPINYGIEDSVYLRKQEQYLNEAYSAIMQKCSDDPIFASKVEESVRRIITYKYRNNIINPVNREATGKKGYTETIERISKNVHTVNKEFAGVKNADAIKIYSDRVNGIKDGDWDTNYQFGPFFEKRASTLGLKMPIESHYLSANTYKTDFASIKETDTVIIVAERVKIDQYFKNPDGTGYFKKAYIQDMVREALKYTNNVIYVTLRDMTAAKSLNDVVTITNHQNIFNNFEILIDELVTGEIQVLGYDSE